MHPALFYRPGERLSLPELAAARLDGDVIEVGEGFMPMDTVESSAARAVSIAALLPENTAASGPSAAWVHGARDRPPVVHHATRTSRSRLRAQSAARVVYHDLPIAAEDLQRIGGIAVTTPLATAVTLLFDQVRHGDDDGWLRGLLQVCPGLADATRARIAPIVRRPGTRAAKRLLADIIAEQGEGVGDQDVVTR